MGLFFVGIGVVGRGLGLLGEAWLLICLGGLAADLLVRLGCRFALPCLSAPRGRFQRVKEAKYASLRDAII